MKYLAPHNIIIEYNNHKFKLNWMDLWKDNIHLIGATILDFKTLGTPAQILFGVLKERQLKIVGQWGRGELYSQYLSEVIACEHKDI